MLLIVNPSRMKKNLVILSFMQTDSISVAAPSSVEATSITMLLQQRGGKQLSAFSQMAVFFGGGVELLLLQSLQSRLLCGETSMTLFPWE